MDCYILWLIYLFFIAAQVLEARLRSVPSPAQRSIHYLRSQLLVAKLASLLYLGKASLPPAAPLRLFWSILGALSPEREPVPGFEEERRPQLTCTKSHGKFGGWSPLRFT